MKEKETKETKEKEKKEVTVYADGSCLKNPGPGGWGVVMVYKGHEKEMSGGEENTTNNRMELTAVIRALSALKEPCIVHLISDSKYVIDALSLGWAVKWKNSGWKKADRKPALNPDLWEKLLELCSVHTLDYEWVKGHAGHIYNERCDTLARGEAQKIEDRLESAGTTEE